MVKGEGRRKKGEGSSVTSSFHIVIVSQRQPLHLLQGDAEDAAEGEALGEAVGDTDAGAGELEEVEGRFAVGQDEDELAWEVFAVVGVEVQRLEVVAEVHLPKGRHAAAEFGQRDVERQRPEDPVLLREFPAPVVFLFLPQLLQSHRTAKYVTGALALTSRPLF